MDKILELQLEIPTIEKEARLDHTLVQLLPDFSRNQIQTWIKNQELTLNGRPTQSKVKVRGGESIDIKAYLQRDPQWEAQSIPLNVIFEDEDILILNKPQGIVAHPAAGNPDNTLLNAILNHCPNASTLPRGGLIHRLDKDTSGLLIVAKSFAAHKKLVADLQDRKIHRQYLAIVNHPMISGGTINQPLGRHPRNRIKMAIVENGKDAVTHYRIKQKFRKHTQLTVSLETGRTHQIRVHFSSMNHAIVGDKIYGYRPLLPKQADEALREQLQNFPRQALHAQHLELNHPISGEKISYTAPVPDDIQSLVELLEKDLVANLEQ